jgi:hypothetical protein
MRRALSVVVAAALSATSLVVHVTPAGADHCGGAAMVNDRGVKVSCDHGKLIVTTPGPHRLYDPDELVTAVSEVDGQPCTILATETSDQGRGAVEFERSLDSIPLLGPVFRAVWGAVVDSLPGCPGGPSPTQVATLILVRQLVRPPSPEPHVAPGWAVTGKPGYLETRAPLAHTAAPIPTRLGPLSVTFTAGTFTVDWGDGTGRDRGPFQSPGRPWPHGEARHVYTRVGTYDIVVTQQWDARWELAGESGRVPVESVGRIEDFEARQLQAVRRR